MANSHARRWLEKCNDGGEVHYLNPWKRMQSLSASLSGHLVYADSQPPIILALKRIKVRFPKLKEKKTRAIKETCYIQTLVRFSKLEHFINLSRIF